MTDRPLLFSAPMVKALLAGTKTQTRRLLKIPAWLDAGAAWADPGLGAGGYLKAPATGGDTVERVRSPYAVGDRLWVRETWAVGKCSDGLSPSMLSPGFWLHDNGGIWYAAGGEPAAPVSPRSTWRPSIFMPRWASRLTLTVSDVRVQRLHEISEADAMAEGVCTFLESTDSTRWGNLSADDRAMMVRIHYGSAVKAYSHLWETINGADAWPVNPWVVAVTFTVHECNVDRMPAAKVAA